MFLSKKFDKLIDGLAKATSFLYARLDRGLYLSNLAREATKQIEGHTTLALAPAFNGAACPNCNIKQYTDVQKIVDRVHRKYLDAFPSDKAKYLVESIRGEKPPRAWEYKYPDPGKCEKCQGCKLCHGLQQIFTVNCENLGIRMDEIPDSWAFKTRDKYEDDGEDFFMHEVEQWECPCGCGFRGEKPT